MAGAITARFTEGKVEPREELDLEEGEEVLVAAWDFQRIPGARGPVPLTVER